MTPERADRIVSIPFKRESTAKVALGDAVLRLGEKTLVRFNSLQTGKHSESQLRSVVDRLDVVSIPFKRESTAKGS